jgi:hypothetical protein
MRSWRPAAPAAGWAASQLLCLDGPTHAGARADALLTAFVARGAGATFVGVLACWRCVRCARRSAGAGEATMASGVGRKNGACCAPAGAGGRRTGEGPRGGRVALLIPFLFCLTTAAPMSSSSARCSAAAPLRTADGSHGRQRLGRGRLRQRGAGGAGASGVGTGRAGCVARPWTRAAPQLAGGRAVRRREAGERILLRDLRRCLLGGARFRLPPRPAPPHKTLVAAELLLCRAGWRGRRSW